MNGTSAGFEQGISEVACMVHDLRNPLAAIQGGAELLVRSKLSGPQVHRIARNLYGASLRMKELLDEFLSRSTVMDRPAEPSDLSELIHGAVDKIAVIADSQSVHILQDVPDRQVIVLDRRRIRSVIVNLLVNALEAMPHGGTIRVSAVREPHAVVVRVRDTGPGIAPEIRERLFEPFATAGKANGAGLGLAFSRKAVIDHGGQMWADSSSRGACFAFRLPISIAKPHSVAC